MVDGVRAAVVGPYRTNRVLNAGSDRMDRSSHFMLCWREHDSLCLKNKWITAACTLIVFVTQHVRLIFVDIVPHRNMSFDGVGQLVPVLYWEYPTQRPRGPSVP